MANEFKIKKGLIVTGATGGTVVDIQGSQGQLFSVTDNLTGSNIFAVSDISGVPILQCGVDYGSSNVSINMSYYNGYALNVGDGLNGSIITTGRIFGGDNFYIQNEAIFANGPVVAGMTTYSGTNAKVIVKGNQTFGLPGSTFNNSGRYLSIEGNADGSAEGSGRIFFTEHNSTTAGMDNYGMSLGYRGGSTSIVGASGNTWTGLTQIGNGQWGMWGHDNNATGALIMSGDRAATYVEFHSNDIKGAGDIYVADQIIHTGDTNTYMQFHAADQWRVVTGGTERLEVNNSLSTFTTPTLIQTTGGGMLTLKDTNSTGDAATPYINFVDSAGTRQGYVGIGSGSSAKLYLEGLDGIETNNPLTVNGNLSTSGDLTVSGGDITLGGTGRITGVDTVSASTDAANKAYVDAQGTNFLVNEGSFISGDTLLEILETDTTADVRVKLNKSTTTTIERIDDHTAPAGGCFQLNNAYISFTLPQYHKLDDDQEYTFELWGKFISGTDTNQLTYLGSSFYGSTKNYLGNSQRYWGESGFAIDSDSNNDGWYFMSGTLGPDRGSGTGNIPTAAHWMKLIMLLNYSTQA